MLKILSKLYDSLLDKYKKLGGVLCKLIYSLSLSFLM